MICLVSGECNAGMSGTRAVGTLYGVNTTSNSNGRMCVSIILCDFMTSIWWHWFDDIRSFDRLHVWQAYSRVSSSYLQRIDPVPETGNGMGTARASVLPRTQGSAAASVKWFGWAALCSPPNEKPTQLVHCESACFVYDDWSKQLCALSESQTKQSRQMGLRLF